MMNTQTLLVYPELLINSVKIKLASCFGLAMIPKTTAQATPPAMVQKAPNKFIAGSHLHCNQSMALGRPLLREMLITSVSD